MTQEFVGFAPTSTATTKDTEPEVVAGIASGDLEPGHKLRIETAGPGPGYGRALLMMAAGLAAGYAAARWLRRG